MNVLNDLRKGKIAPDDINVDLFTATKDKLLSGLEKGAGVDFAKVDYSSKDYNLLMEMRKNVYAFARCKEYQQLRAMNDLLLDKEGNIVPFSEFKRNIEAYRQQALKLNEQYNVHWLEAEYQMAVHQAQAAVMWRDFEANKDLFPNLKYVTVGDERVRHSHAVLDGLIKAIDDPIWNTIYPPKDWGCRCHCEPTDEAPHDGDMPKGYKTDPAFDGNVGKEGSIFSDKHPYQLENGINKRKMAEEAEGLWAEERRKINRKIYNDFAGDENYEQEFFDNKTGGFIIRHKNAQETLTSSEKEVINTLVNKGNRIIIPEYSYIPHTKNFDLTIDSSNWDIKELAGDMKRNTERKIEDAMEQANNVILYLKEKPDMTEIVRGLGNVKNNKRLNSVMFIYNNKVAVINIADIKAGNFDVLTKLL